MALFKIWSKENIGNRFFFVRISIKGKSCSSFRSPASTMRHQTDGLIIKSKEIWNMPNFSNKTVFRTIIINFLFLHIFFYFFFHYKQDRRKQLLRKYFLRWRSKEMLFLIASIELLSIFLFINIYVVPCTSLSSLYLDLTLCFVTEND